MWKKNIFRKAFGHHISLHEKKTYFVNLFFFQGDNEFCEEYPERKQVSTPNFSV